MENSRMCSFSLSLCIEMTAASIVKQRENNKKKTVRWNGSNYVTIQIVPAIYIEMVIPHLLYLFYPK